MDTLFGFADGLTTVDGLITGALEGMSVPWSAVCLD